MYTLQMKNIEILLGRICLFMKCYNPHILHTVNLLYCMLLYGYYLPFLTFILSPMEKTTEKTLTKIQLAYEICYFTKCDIQNHLSRANDLQGIIREIAIVNIENINFILTGKNSSWS